MKNFQVIIPAAGKATRMRPLSSGVSKCMIPVNGKPIISYIIDKLKNLGNPIDIVIVHNELNDVKEFVANTYPQMYEESRIVFAEQKNPKGPLHAIEIGAKKLVINQIGENYKMPILVWLGDTICLEDFNITESFLATSSVDDYSRWCLVDDECNFYDKPEVAPRTNQALIGIYNFCNPHLFFNSLKRGMKMPTLKNEHQISSLLDSYISNGGFFELQNTEKWYDCGELQTFYESKARLLNNSARSFNQISVDTFLGTVTKTSDDKQKQDKIQQEKDWFLSLPDEMSLFCPRILPSDYGVLKMSHEPGTALSEMWIYENMRFENWTQVIDKILKIHNTVFLDRAQNINSRNAMKEMYLVKNLKRFDDIIETFPEFENTELVKNFIKTTAADLIETTPVWSKYFHGDSHLGNILFEPLHGGIKFVDPRGAFGNLQGSQGDLRYDMAKLVQDFYLRYAEIVAGNYYIDSDDSIKFFKAQDLTNKIIKHIKRKLTEYGYEWEQIFRLSILLIITCIPFHSDNPERQRAFWKIATEKIKVFAY